MTRSQVRGMAAGGSGRGCGGLLAFLALAPFPFHRVCSRVFELGDQGRGLSAALGVLRGLGGREARQALCGYLGPFTFTAGPSIREPPQSPLPCTRPRVSSPGHCRGCVQGRSLYPLPFSPGISTSKTQLPSRSPFPHRASLSLSLCRFKFSIFDNYLLSMSGDSG